MVTLNSKYNIIKIQYWILSSWQDYKPCVSLWLHTYDQTIHAHIWEAVPPPRNKLGVIIILIYARSVGCLMEHDCLKFNVTIRQNFLDIFKTYKKSRSTAHHYSTMGAILLYWSGQSANSLWNVSSNREQSKPCHKLLGSFYHKLLFLFIMFLI